MHPKKLVLAAAPLAVLAQVDGERLHARDLTTGGIHGIRTPLIHRSLPTEGLKPRYSPPPFIYDVKHLNGTNQSLYQNSASTKKAGALPQHRVRKRAPQKEGLTYRARHSFEKEEGEEKKPYVGKKKWRQKNRTGGNQDDDGIKALRVRNESAEAGDKKAVNVNVDTNPKVSVSVDRKPGSGLDFKLDIGGPE